jgi:hypothetical protein
LFLVLHYTGRKKLTAEAVPILKRYRDGQKECLSGQPLKYTKENTKIYGQTAQGIYEVVEGMLR